MNFTITKSVFQGQGNVTERIASYQQVFFRHAEPLSCMCINKPSEALSFSRALPEKVVKISYPGDIVNWIKSAIIKLLNRRWCT